MGASQRLRAGDGIHFSGGGRRRFQRSRAALLDDLRRAPRRDQMALVAQPLRYLSGTPIRATEVLLRWDHPQLGPVPASEFIALAEDGGIIEELGEWSLRQACALAATWRKDDSARQFLPFTVNVPAEQLARADFSDCVAEALAFAGASPKDIGLEIREGPLLAQRGASAWSLAALEEMGVYTLLDGFGRDRDAGEHLARLHDPSKLRHLERLSIDAVKIDRQFVAGLLGEGPEAAIAAATCAMASAFSIEVVAEGIEEASQIEALRGLGCILGQGYYFDRPLPPEKLAPASSTAERASSSEE